MAASRTLRRSLLGSCAALLLVCMARGASAQSLGDEAVAKAKLVTALIRFVQWPAHTFDDDASPVRLCIYTQSQGLERAFQAYDRAAIGRRALQLAFNPPRGQIGQSGSQACHALYLDDASRMAMADLRGNSASGVPGTPFSVGNADGFLADGGMVELVHVENSMRFDVNLGALKDAGLSVNPGVLKLARRVKP
jgi:hypothetical protein